MQWSKLNPYKLPIIAGSFAFAFLVAVFSFLYGVKKSSVVDNPAQANPAQAQTQPTNTEIDLKIKGNRKSKIYHLRGCPNYADLKESNIVWFKTKEEAEASGYRMARNC
jgi:hypothetical protein